MKLALIAFASLAAAAQGITPPQLKLTPPPQTEIVLLALVGTEFTKISLGPGFALSPIATGGFTLSFTAPPPPPPPAPEDFVMVPRLLTRDTGGAYGPWVPGGIVMRNGVGQSDIDFSVDPSDSTKIRPQPLFPWSDTDSVVLWVLVRKAPPIQPLP